MMKPQKETLGRHFKILTQAVTLEEKPQAKAVNADVDEWDNNEPKSLCTRKETVE